MIKTAQEILSGIVDVRYRTSLALALALFAVLYGLSINEHLSAYDDNAAYILLARGLIEDGNYSINLDGNPRLHTQVPPGFPIMLIPVYWISGGSVVAMKTFVALMAVAAIGVLFLLFRSLMTPAQSFLLLFLLGFSRQIGMFANKVMTEAPFLLLLGVGMLAAHSYVQDESWKSRSGFVAAVFLSIAAFTRTIGLAAGVAVAAFVFVEHFKTKNLNVGFAKAGLITTFVVTAQLVWFLRNMLVAGTLTKYVGQFTLVSPTTPDSPTADLTMMVARFFDNLAYYTPLITQSVLSYRHPTLFPNWALAVTLSIVVLAGIVYSIERRSSVIEWVFFALFAVTLLWPWQTMRLAVPLIPFFLYYVVIGISALVERWSCLQSNLLRHAFVATLVAVPAYSLSTNLAGRGRYSLIHWVACLAAMTITALVLRKLAGFKFITATLAVSAAALVCSSLIWHVQRNVIRERQEPYYYLISDGWGEYRDTAEWLKNHAPEDSLVICRKPYLMRLWTDRWTSRYTVTTNRERLLGNLLGKEKGLVVLDSFKWTRTTSTYLKPVIEANQPNFEEVFAIGESKVLRVKRSGPRSELGSEESTSAE